MYFKHYLKPISLVLIAFSFPQVFAVTSINIQTTFYNISGTDSKSIQKSLSTYGPTGKDGKRYHALTNWKIDWNYRWISSNTHCQLEKVEVNTDVTYLMPELSSKPSLSKIMHNRWNRYYLALFKHEQQHKDYAVSAAKELDRELNTLKLQPCAQLEKNISAQAQSILDKYKRLEKGFDRRTEHGIKQGVLLP